MLESVGGLSVDFQAIEQSNNSTIKIAGKSGRPLSISVERRVICIKALDDPYIHLYIEAVDNGSQRTLFLDLNTKEENSNIRHPDLHAGELVDVAIHYLENRGALTELSFDWRSKYKRMDGGRKSPSDTFAQYCRAKERYLQENGGAANSKAQARKHAVFQTWTGRRVAQRHGFTQLKSIEEHRNEQGQLTSVKGIFSRDKQTIKPRWSRL